MTLYLVEAYVARLNDARVHGLANRARAAAQAMTRRGIPVRHLSSIFVPEDDTCFHLLEAASAGAVRDTCDRAGFSFERIVEAVRPFAISGSPEERRVLMTQFMVERHLPGFPPDQLPAAAGAAKAKSIELTGEGTEIQYIRSTWVPDGEKCFCLFEASSRDAVAEVQQRAELPYERIHEAAFLTAEQV
jgi:Protein of unknown function (DUF4242)